ncbi:MAG: NAD(P)/FAD-dependent oxidoreductase [Verrucomicrobiota bacterium]
MVEKYDVIVVGAGPSGSLYALLTARAGLNTLIIDRAHFPRPKVCLGYFNSLAIDLLMKMDIEEPFSEVPHSKISRWKISSGKGNPIEWALQDKDENKALALSRPLFDDWLRKLAIQAGAECLTGVHIQSFVDDETIQTDHGNFKTHLVVGADGRKSMIAQRANPKQSFPPARRIGWQSNLPSEFVENCMRIHFFDSGYWTTVPISKDQASLCFVLTAQATQTPQFLLSNFFPNAPALVWRSSSPLFRPPCYSRDNILLIGDACHVWEPLLSEGIYLSLLSAYEASKLTIKASESKNYKNLAPELNKTLGKIHQPFIPRNHIALNLGLYPKIANKGLKLLSRNPEYFKKFYRYLSDS